MRRFYRFFSLCLLCCLLASCTVDKPAVNPTGEPTAEPTAEPSFDPAPSYEQICTEWASSPYLSSSAAFGVDKTRMETEVLYPFPSDSDFEIILNLADYGMSETASATDNDKAIFKTLFALKKTGAMTKVVFPNGVIDLSRGITLSGLSNVYICGSGETVLRFSDYAGAFTFRNCANIHLSNLSVTYSDTPIITATVERYNEITRTVQLTLDEGFDVNDPHYTQYVYGYYTLRQTDGRYCIDFDAPTRYSVGDTRRAHDTNKMSVTFSSAQNVLPEKGDRVAVVMNQYGNACLVSTESENIYYENIKADTTPGMCLVSTYCENLYINRFTLTPNVGRGLYIASSADGIHTVSVRGKMVLTNSVIDAPQDDNLNVCTGYETVVSVNGKTLTFTGNNTRMRVGDTLEFYNPADWSLVDSAKVVALTEGVATLDRSPVGVSAGFLVANDTAATELTMENCLFEHGIGRCLIQARRVTIRNCSFYHLRGAALRIHATSDIFREGILPRDITVTACKIIRCNQLHEYMGAVDVVANVYETGATTVGTIRGVTVKNCLIAETPGCAVALYGVSNATITDNDFYRVATETRTNLPTGRMEYYTHLEGHVNGPSFHGSLVGGMFCRAVTVKDNNAAGIPDGVREADFEAETCTEITLK